VLSPLFSEAKPAGAQTFTFNAAPGLLPGQYTIQLAAMSATGTSVSASVPFTIDDSIDAIASSPAIFSAAKHGVVSMSFTVTRALVSSIFQVLRGSEVVASPPVASLDPGARTLTWDGTLSDGTTAPDGTYQLAFSVTDAFTTFTRTATVTLDSTPPKLTVLSYRGLRFRLSEPAILTLVVGTHRYSRTLKQPKTLSFWLKQKPRAYRLIATDTAGNVSVVRYRGK
jgi:hypothetical protein